MEHIGPYQIQDELGRGGMGVVYRGIDPVIGRTVAVKTLHASDLGDEQDKLKERLFREAKSAGILSHPGIVTIYQAGQDKDILFIAMEFIDGPNLATALSRARPSVDLMLDLVKQAAEALDYAHSKGVIHRDVKPANLLLQSDGRIKIADFGIAKLAAHNLTRTGTTVGSPAYMSPEQIRASPVDGRADQYSLAVLAYEMLTGLRPYESETITSLVFKIVFEQPDLSKLDDVAGASALEPVFRKALSKSAEDRYPTCVSFWQALSDASKGTKQAQAADTLLFSPPAVVADEEKARPIEHSSAGNQKKIFAIAAVALLLIGGGGGLWMWTHRDPAPITNPDKGKTPDPPPTGQEKPTPPELIQQVKPEYTPAALKAGLEGVVRLSIVINEQGRVEEVQVTGPLDPGLDLKAIEAVKKWKFIPAKMKGQPVAIRSRADIEFHINK